MSITHKCNKLPVNEYPKHCHRRLVYGRYQELEQRHRSHPLAVAAEVSHRPLRVYPADIRYRCLLSLRLHSSITITTTTPPPQPQPPTSPPLRNSNVSVSPKQHPLSLPSSNPTPPPRNLIGNPSLSDLQSFSSLDAINFQDQIPIVSHLLHLLLKPVILVKLPAKLHIQLIETTTRRRRRRRRRRRKSNHPRRKLYSQQQKQRILPSMIKNVLHHQCLLLRLLLLLLLLLL